MKCAKCDAVIKTNTCYVSTEDNAVVCSPHCGKQYVLDKLAQQLFDETFEKILTKEIS
jgi:hypothetical protein